MSKGKTADDKILGFLYNVKFGNFILRKIIIKPWFSRCISKYYYSKLSARGINKFAKKNNIDLAQLPIDLQVHPNKKFHSFNDFFSRKEVRNCEGNEGIFPAVADSRLSIYSINSELELEIKGTKYKLEELLQEENCVENKYLDKSWDKGLCLVFRLCVDDYHRYIYPDDGDVIDQKLIKGTLHTVRDIAQKERVFARNKRVVNTLKTKHFGEIIQIEVGALLIGDIINHQVKTFQKSQEKGYFSYCASTVIVLIKKDKIQLFDRDKDRINTGEERRIKMGEDIGCAQ